MTRYVVTNEEVTHLWAHAAQDGARSGNGQLFFRDDLIFSYGEHFLLAIRLDATTVLLNTSRASITTSRHQYLVMWATDHMAWRFIPRLTTLWKEYPQVTDYLRHRPGVTQAAARKQARLFIKKYSEEMTDDAIRWLLKQVESEAHFRNIRAAEERKLQKCKAKEEARHLKRERFIAKILAQKLTDEKLRKFLLSQSRPYSLPDWQRELVGKKPILEQPKAARYRLYQLARVAEATHWTAIGKRLRQLANVVKPIETNAQARFSRHLWYESFRNDLVHFRRALKLFKTATDPRGRLDANQGIYEYAQRLRMCLRIPAAVRAKLEALENQAQMRHPELDAKYTTWKLEQDRLETERIAAQIAAWRAGGPRPTGHYHFNSVYGGVAVRATGVKRGSAGQIIDGTLETSKGARVPLLQAIRGYKLCKHVAHSGRSVPQPRMQFGPFDLDRVDVDGTLHAGCHMIKLAEMQILAQELGIV